MGLSWLRSFILSQSYFKSIRSEGVQTRPNAVDLNICHCWYLQKHTAFNQLWRKNSTDQVLSWFSFGLTPCCPALVMVMTWFQSSYYEKPLCLYISSEKQKLVKHFSQRFLPKACFISVMWLEHNGSMSEINLQKEDLTALWEKHSVLLFPQLQAFHQKTQG